MAVKDGKIQKLHLKHHGTDVTSEAAPWKMMHFSSFVVLLRPAPSVQKKGQMYYALARSKPCVCRGRRICPAKQLHSESSLSGRFRN